MRERLDAWWHDVRYAARTLVRQRAFALVVIATVWNNPANSLIGYAILAAGIPAFLYWRKANAP